MAGVSAPATFFLMGSAQSTMSYMTWTLVMMSVWPGLIEVPASATAISNLAVGA